MSLLIQTFLAIALTVASLNSTNAYSGENKFVSAHTVALDGVIPNGKLLTKSNQPWVIKNEIKEQLMYSIGQLNGLDGGSPDMNRLEVEIKNTGIHTSGLNEVSYSAKLFIAWPLEQNVPSSYILKVPAQGSWLGLNNFFKAFGSDEHSSKKCLAWEAHDVTYNMFWYYYRPQKSLCPLKYMNSVDPLVATTIEIYLAKSEKNTTGKYPEYTKIWEDGKLVVTAIFGMADEDNISEWDAGVSAYKSTVNSILRRFGVPASSNVSLLNNTFSNALNNKEVQLRFSTPKGQVDIVLYLVKGIRSTSTEFRSVYNERTKISDFVSYSGHSGLGANIRALANMGEFEANQYQLFLINGCDTFSYVDDALRNAHQAVNQAYGKDKFVDVITNAMPSYFHMNNRSNMAIIDALYNSKKTYREILSGFDQSQRAVVTGEEDNRFPEAFYE